MAPSSPQRGRFAFWSSPSAIPSPVNSCCTCQLLLHELAQHYPETLTSVLMANGSCHTARALVIPDHMVCVFLPPSSPELNPIERLWQDLKKRLAWVLVAQIDALAQQVATLRAPYAKAISQSLTAYPYVVQADQALGVGLLSTGNHQRGRYGAHDWSEEGLRCRAIVGALFAHQGASRRPHATTNNGSEHRTAAGNRSQCCATCGANRAAAQRPLLRRCHVCTSYESEHRHNKDGRKETFHGTFPRELWTGVFENRVPACSASALPSPDRP
jgi:hypothetical protein